MRQKYANHTDDRNHLNDTANRLFIIMHSMHPRALLPAYLFFPLHDVQEPMRISGCLPLFKDGNRAA